LSDNHLSAVAATTTDERMVLTNVSGVVATVTLDRPQQRNPLDWRTVKRLGELVRAFETDASVQVVVVRGAGGNFSAGGDMKGYVDLYRDAAAFRQFLVEFHALLDAIEASSKIYVAVIEGYCVAGGLELLLACDLVLAAESAKIGDAHIGFGQLPGAGGSQRLPRAVGPMRARYLMLTGDILDAAQAERIGLVSKVAPDADLDATLARIVSRVARASPLGREGMKHLVRVASRTDLAEGLRTELEYVWRYATTSVDATEGLVAFGEKRPPRFTGA
jgi:enoyl-CoA hydratase/carnithine racemase